jgi:hypothetical protein
MEAPQYDGEATHTIAEFKQQFTSDLEEIPYYVVISGLVTANDESGNLYKKFVIQDKTGAIELSVDRTNMYTEYKVGQQVFVECEGLYTGKYGGLQQIGYKYQNSSSGAYQMGRMSIDLAENHLFRNDYPGEAPVPDTITMSQLADSVMDRLVTFEKVRFANGGQETFANKDESYPTSQTIVDENGKTIVVYTSSYANFAGETLPEGKGTVTGIMSYFNGTWQLLIRDMNDVTNFDDTDQGGGDNGSGDNTTVTFVDENFDSGTNGESAAINGWSVVKVEGDRDWQIKVYTDNKDGSTSTYAQASAYNGKSEVYEYWLLTPAIDMDKATNKSMSFETAKAYWASSSSLEVYILDSKDLSAAHKEKPENVRLAQDSDVDHTFISSGNIDLSAQTGVKYIGFRYVAKGGSESTTFRLDNFKFGEISNK